MTQSGAPYPDQFFEREDSTNDARFYDWPRMVVHIDRGKLITAAAVIYTPSFCRHPGVCWISMSSRRRPSTRYARTERIGGDRAGDEC